MQNNNRDDYGSVLIMDTAKESAREYQMGRHKERRRIEEGFFDQSVDYRAYVLSPEGYEGAMTALYIALIPYLAGLAFLFLFIARGQFEHFITFDLTSFFIIWAIGYEVCAGVILIGIFIAWLKYFANRWNEE